MAGEYNRFWNNNHQVVLEYQSPVNTAKINLHQLNVQAVITLQVAVETCIAEKYGSEDSIGNYEWWQETGRKELNKLKFPNNHEYGSNNKKQIGLPLNNLENFRNQIAHGGGKNKAGNFPQAANIPGIYESGIRGIKNLFELLGI